MSEILKLSKKILIDGEEKSEIQYDFDNLTGGAIETSIKDLQKTGYVPAVQEVDSLLHASLFAQAAGIDHEDIKRFGAKDYMKVVGLVRDFLLTDSEDSQQKNS